MSLKVMRHELGHRGDTLDLSSIDLPIHLDDRHAELIAFLAEMDTALRKRKLLGYQAKVNTLIRWIVHPLVTQVPDNHRECDAQNGGERPWAGHKLALETPPKKRTHKSFRIAEMFLNPGVEDELRRHAEQFSLTLRLLSKFEHWHILDAIEVGIVKQVMKTPSVEWIYMTTEAIDVIRETLPEPSIAMPRSRAAVAKRYL